MSSNMSRLVIFFFFFFFWGGGGGGGWAAPGVTNQIRGVAGSSHRWPLRCIMKNMFPQRSRHLGGGVKHRPCTVFSYRPAASCGPSAAPAWAASVWSSHGPAPTCFFLRRSWPSHLPLTHSRQVEVVSAYMFKNAKTLQCTQELIKEISLIQSFQKTLGTLVVLMWRVMNDLSLSKHAERTHRFFKNKTNPLTCFKSRMKRSSCPASSNPTKNLPSTHVFTYALRCQLQFYYHYTWSWQRLGIKLIPVGQL